MIRRTTLGLATLLLVGIAAISPAAHATMTISGCGFTAGTSGNYIVTVDLTAIIYLTHHAIRAIL